MDSRHTRRIAPNLLESDFTAARANQVLAGDQSKRSAQSGQLGMVGRMKREMASPHRNLGESQSDWRSTLDSYPGV